MSVPSTACGCVLCAAEPAPTYTEAHRFACELRHVANLPTKDDRRRYLAGVRAQRGGDPALELVAGLKRMHEARSVAA